MTDRVQLVATTERRKAAPQDAEAPRRRVEDIEALHRQAAMSTAKVDAALDELDKLLASAS